MTTLVDWRALPRNLLCLISARLPSTLDCVHFRSVCSKWRSSAPKRPQPLLGLIADDKRHKYFRSFHGISASAWFTVTPAATAFLWVYGFSFGWMAYWNSSLGITLYNPVTKSQIQLPPMSAHENDVYTNITFSSDPTVDGCVVMILSRGGAAFCRPGDDAWITRDRTFNTKIATCVFHDGRFYIFDTRFHVCSVGTNGPVIEELGVGGLRLNFYSLWGSEEKFYYLVKAAEDLLWVVLTRNGDCRDVKVYRFDNSHEGRPTLLRVKRLDDRAVFLGPRGHALSFSEHELPGCKPNHIYLIECKMWSTYEVRSRIMRIVNLEDGSDEEYCSGLLDASMEPVTWFALSQG